MLIDICLMIVLFKSISCFNLDVRDEAVIRPQNPQINSPNGSYFGYSLALHLPKNFKEGQRLLVGSPGYNQFRGAVQVCKKANSDLYRFSCEMAKSPANNDVTANSWLGATVVTDAGLGLALACAPRTDVAEGLCYYTENKFDDSSRFRLTQAKAHKLCQFGFSAAFAMGKNKLSKLFISAPTCEIQWDPTIQRYVDASYVFFTENPKDLQKTSKWIDMENYYKGYAMATDGQKMLAASVGFHVDTGYAGKVYVTGVDTNKIVAEIKGHQSGEQFGASLAVTDVNRDGRDDIIIGAPHHTDYEHPELKYEIGAVYVYLQTDSGGFENISTNEPMKGQTTGGRFGYAVAALGDTNLDGYNDVAVGAPYENENGNVYIYHGSKTGLKPIPAQIISGNSFKPPISSFGFSFSSTKSDFDENQYYDVFVGAYQSDAVVYLPARPIVRVSADFTFIEENLALNKKNFDCILPSSRLPGSESLEVACTEVRFCLAYTGEGVQEMGFNVKIYLDDLIDDFESRRLLFLENSQHFLQKNITGLTNNNNQRCLTSKVYGKLNVTNIVTLVQGKMTVELLIPRSQQPDTIRKLLPILDVETVTFYSNFMSLSDPDIGNNNSVPWWVYLVAILGALLFLGLIAAVLHKLGFFKRKLPPNADQQQQETPNIAEEPQQTNQ